MDREQLKFIVPAVMEWKKSVVRMQIDEERKILKAKRGRILVFIKEIGYFCTALVQLEL